MNHTPGPWIRDDDEIGIELMVGDDPNLLVVCTLDEPGLYNTPDTLIQKEANAHLIMAAPDLLEALTKLISAWPDGLACDAETSKVIDTAYDAIAKAEGRTA